MLKSLTITEKEMMARTPIHPGEILGDELDEIGMSAKKLADVIDVPLIASISSLRESET